MNRNINVEAIASKVKAHMMGDIRREVINLFEKSGVDANTLARNLHISVNDINSVMNQDASSLNLDAFIKLLIVTGNALEVKPVTMCPKKRNVRPVGNMGTPTPHMPFEPDMNFRENIIPSRPWERPSNDISDTTRFMTDLVGMSKQQLMGMIMSQHWEDEIDIQNSSRKQLIDFIITKRINSVSSTTTTRPPSFEEDRNLFEDSNENTETSTPNLDFDGLMEAFKEFIKNNPSVIPSR